MYALTTCDMSLRGRRDRNTYELPEANVTVRESSVGSVSQSREIHTL